MGIIYDATPTIHKVDYSFCVNKNTTFTRLKRDLEQTFGIAIPNVVNPEKENQRFKFTFDDENISIIKSCPANYHWATLSFIPSKIDINALLDVLTSNTGLFYPNVDEIETYQNLPGVEVKFDFHMDDCGKEEHLALANFFATYLLPEIPSRSYYTDIVGSEQEKEEYINGSQAHYWYSHKNNNILTGYAPKRAKKSSFCKIYTKYDKIDKIWFIRFETTLRTNQLKRILGRKTKSKLNLPFEFVEIMNNIKNTHFDQFYKFYTSDFDKFIADIKDNDNFKKCKIKSYNQDFNNLMKQSDENYWSKLSYRYYFMRVIAKRFGTKKINDSKKSKYLTIIYEDELANMLKKGLRFDINNMRLLHNT